jgi:hypothetical protein
MIAAALSGMKQAGVYAKTIAPFAHSSTRELAEVPGAAEKAAQAAAR